MALQVRTYGRSHPALIDSLDRASDGLEEELEAVFVFHRHGDRTPGRSLVAEDVGEDESNFWKTKIPPASCYDILCQRFPAIHQSKSAKDSNSYMNYDSFSETSAGYRSYGFLTWKGMHQMYHNGVSIARKYTPTARHVMSFRDHWDVKAVSTNYLRTVVSCQAFLDGLLTTNSITGKYDVPLNYNYPTHYERNPLEEYRAECDVSETVDILVRDDESETLNAFEASPKLMKKLMGDVFATPEFIANDQKATSLKSELIDYLPGLVRHGTYAEMPSPSSDIKINWVSEKLSKRKRRRKWAHAHSHGNCRILFIMQRTQSLQNHFLTFCPFSYYRFMQQITLYADRHIPSTRRYFVRTSKETRITKRSDLQPLEQRHFPTYNKGFMATIRIPGFLGKWRVLPYTRW